MPRPLASVPKLRKLKGLPKFKARLPRRIAPEESLPEASAVQELLNPEEQELRNKLGDTPATLKLIERLGRIRQRLAKERPAELSLPNLLTYDWLTRHHIDFDFQSHPIFGGRFFKGGQDPDFVVHVGGGVLVWRIQGDYWHSRKGERAKDLAERIQLLAQGEIAGLPIISVVDIWESAIYDDIRHNRGRIFRLAMVGVEIGKA